MFCSWQTTWCCAKDSIQFRVNVFEIFWPIFMEAFALLFMFCNSVRVFLNKRGGLTILMDIYISISISNGYSNSTSINCFIKLYSTRIWRILTLKYQKYKQLQIRFFLKMLITRYLIIYHDMDLRYLQSNAKCNYRCQEESSEGHQH